MEKYKGKTIVFCFPGRQFSNNFLISWTQLFGWCIKNGINVLVSDAYSPNLYYVRNMCLRGDVLRGIKQKPFNGEVKYDYIMWIDSDIVFGIEQFVELLNLDKPIASGLYMMSDNIHYATVENMDDEFFKSNGYYQFLNRDDIANKTEPFKVDYTGFGWILIKHGVFEQIDYPWFRPDWFQFEKQGVTISEFSMEDVAFCKLVKERGYDVWVSPKAIVGHEKMVVL